MAKSVIIRYQMEVVDLDEKVYKRAGQEMLKNKGKWLPVAELPDLDMNEAVIYFPCVESGKVRSDQRFSMADRFVNEAAVVIMKSGKDAEIIPYSLILKKEETK